jgi:enamine deaminase RidA (YjgF/YER057c/UK114 family)
MDSVSNGYSSNGNNGLKDSIEEKLNKCGFILPPRLRLPPDIRTPPTWIRIHRNIAYISGHGPQNPDGSVAGPFGKVSEEQEKLAMSKISIEQGYQSAKLAGLSILGTLKRELKTLDRVTAWLQVRVMVNTVPGFTKTTYVADGFSELIISLYGHEKGEHARSAIGVQALPLNLPVIVEAMVEIIPNA